MLDLRTIYFTSIGVSSMCALTIWLFGLKAARSYRGVRYWAVDFTLQAIAAVLIALRGAIPDFVSILLANILVVLGACIGYLGYSRFLGSRRAQWPNFTVLAAFAAVHAYFTFIRPDLDLRNVNVSAAIGFICLRTGYLLVKDGRGRGYAWIAATVNLCYAAICVARAFVYGARPPIDQDYMRSGAVDAVWQALFQALFLFHACAMALMVQARLSERIAENEERFTKAFRSSPYGLAITDAATGEVEEANEGASAITGKLGPWEDQGLLAALAEETLREGRVKRREAAFRGKDGKRAIALVSTETISIGGRKAILWIVDDITERKAMEDAIRNLLDAKETLLREVHHRVKNNMSAISSLLSLQSDRAGEEARAELADAALRVDVMGYLYERVYRSEHYEAMPLAEFLAPLVRDVAGSFPRSEQVRLELELDDRPVGPDKLLPLGMLATEIVSNSMKHAFKGRPDGRISIRSSGRSSLRVVFDDDGVGFNPSSPAARDGFGYTLIQALTKQLRGSFKVDGAGGTRVTIEFKP